MVSKNVAYESQLLSKYEIKTNGNQPMLYKIERQNTFSNYNAFARLIFTKVTLFKINPLLHQGKPLLPPQFNPQKNTVK